MASIKDKMKIGKYIAMIILERHNFEIVASNKDIIAYKDGVYHIIDIITNKISDKNVFNPQVSLIKDGNDYLNTKSIMKRVEDSISKLCFDLDMERDIVLYFNMYIDLY